MSLPDLATLLQRSFAASADLLRRLQQGLAQRRAEWLAARPSTLEQQTAAMHELAERIAAEETNRQQLIARIAPLLPRDGLAKDATLHVNVTRIAARLPRPQAQALRQAADAATAAARTVRGELALGERLLQFTQRSQEAVLHGALAVAAGARGYDRGARAVQGTRGSAPGTLIDGRM